MNATLAQIIVKASSYPEAITVQIFEDEILTECNHAGAETQEFTEYTGYGEHTMEHTVYGLECDKDNCRAQNIAGEWITV